MTVHPLCVCSKGLDSLLHRYIHCERVSPAWETLRDMIETIEPDMLFESNHSLINLYFESSPLESSILWLIGEYVDLVEKEAVPLNKELRSQNLLCHLRTRKLECLKTSMPDIGFIPGLFQSGVG